MPPTRPARSSRDTGADGNGPGLPPVLVGPEPSATSATSSPRTTPTTRQPSAPSTSTSITTNKPATGNRAPVILASTSKAAAAASNRTPSDDRARLCTVIDDLTSSPELAQSISADAVVESPLMAEIKQLCKKSDANVVAAHGFLLQQLARRNSQIRLLSVRVMNELFRRSHVFRGLVVEELPAFLKLACGITATRADASLSEMLLATTGANAGAVDSALPPPVPAAKLLRTTALRSLNAWNATFGTAYRKLALACDFLSNQLKINLRDPDSSSMTQREIRERTTAMRNQQVLELRLRTLIDDELEGRLDEVRETLRETNAVIELLVPSIDGATGSGNVSSASGASHLTDPQLTARAHGLGSSHYQLEVALDGRALQIRRTTDNKALIATITDACKLIESRHLPFIASYIDLLVQVGEAALDSHATQHSRLRAAIDVKRELQAMLDKAHELEFVGAEPLVGEESDDEWEAVSTGKPPVDQEDGNEDEAQIAVHLERDDFNDDDWVSGKRSRDDDSVDEEDADDQVQEEAAEAAAPSVATDSVVSTANAPSNPTVIATPKPTTAGRVVVAGSTVPIPNINAMDTAHRFWGNRDSDDLMSDVPSAMREVLETSVVTYQQEPLEPVKWACRAPLGKAGRLCKRMDREVCPFHGRIVPRDESGNPTDPKFLEELEKRRYADALVAASAISASGSVKVAGQRMTAAAKVKRAKLEAPGVALGRAAPGAEAGGELTARKDDADRLFERDTATVQALRAGHSALDVALAHALTTNAPGSERVNREWMGLERDVLSSPAVAGTLASQKPKPRLTDISDASSSVSSSSSSSGGGGSSKRDPVASFEARMRKGNASRRAILDRMEAQEDKARRDQFGDFWQYRE